MTQGRFYDSKDSRRNMPETQTASLMIESTNLDSDIVIQDKNEKTKNLSKYKSFKPKPQGVTDLPNI